MMTKTKRPVRNEQNANRIVESHQITIAQVICKTARHYGAYLTVQEEEDLISEVNVRALASITGKRAYFDAMRLDQVGGYIAAIARYQTIDLLRSRTIHGRAVQAEDCDLVAKDSTGEDTTDGYQRSAAVQSAMAKLSDTDRKLITMVAQGSDTETLCKALNMSANAVRIRKCRALKVLRSVG